MNNYESLVKLLTEAKIPFTTEKDNDYDAYFITLKDTLLKFSIKDGTYREYVTN